MDKMKPTLVIDEGTPSPTGMPSGMSPKKRQKYMNELKKRGVSNPHSTLETKTNVKYVGGGSVIDDSSPINSDNNSSIEIKRMDSSFNSSNSSLQIIRVGSYVPGTNRDNTITSIKQFDEEVSDTTSQ